VFNITNSIKNFDYKGLGEKTLELGKKFGKAAFTKSDGKGGTMIDKAAVMGAIAFAGSYMEAKALADDAGVELTEGAYDEARKTEKQEEYAGYLTNFFGGKKDGGRIGLKDGTDFENI
jgi:predicted hydrocarbon binding protein